MKNKYLLALILGFVTSITLTSDDIELEEVETIQEGEKTIQISHTPDKNIFVVTIHSSNKFESPCTTFSLTELKNLRSSVNNDAQQSYLWRSKESNYSRSNTTNFPDNSCSTIQMLSKQKKDLEKFDAIVDKIAFLRFVQLFKKK